MIYTDDQIRACIVHWIGDTKECHVKYAIHFCLGYYGYITKQIMRVIDSLVSEGLLTWCE